MSFIAYLDSFCRMPVEIIQSLLEGVYHLHLSQGEIVEVLHIVAAAGHKSYDALLEQVRLSPVVHADETGAREDGLNGYVWSLCTPNIRYYHREQSRAAHVIQTLLGYNPLVYQAKTAGEVTRIQREARETAAQNGAKEHTRFSGVLVSDFYSAYSWYGGSHQRCLVHLDRDLDELRARHADEPSVCSWVDEVLDLIKRAKDYVRSQLDPKVDRCLQPADTRRGRAKRRRAFEEEARKLARPYCHGALPQRVLAERIRRHIRQLFVFVEHLEVPSDNNAAERAIRPFVVQRKVSGGTRSAKGSRTQAVLLSLFGTWFVRGQNTLLACQQMLSGGPAFAPV